MTGINTPLWLQIASTTAGFLGPIALAGFLWIVKERKKTKVDETGQLVDDQRGFIDTMVECAKLAPELLRRNDELQTTNATYLQRINLLESTVARHEKRIIELEVEKEELKTNGEKIPKLENELIILGRLLIEKDRIIDKLTKQLEKIGAI